LIIATTGVITELSDSITKAMAEANGLLTKAMNGRGKQFHDQSDDQRK